MHEQEGNIEIPSVTDTFRKFKWFTIWLIVIFPVYPSLSFLGTGAMVRAGDYDESTIITAYSDFGDVTDEWYISDTGLIRIGWSPSWDISEKDIISSSYWYSKKCCEKTHTVKSRESIASISDKYGVSTDAIVWANDLDPDEELKIGQILKIPPVSWVVHSVVAGDTISGIAAKYKVNASDIVSVNTLRDAASIRIGMDLMIPWAIKHTGAIASAEKSDKSSTTKTSLAKVATKTQDSDNAKIVKKEPTVTISPKTWLKDRYVVKYTGKSRGFVPGIVLGMWHRIRQ